MRKGKGTGRTAELEERYFVHTEKFAKETSWLTFRTFPYGRTGAGAAIRAGARRNRFCPRSEIHRTAVPVPPQIRGGIHKDPVRRPRNRQAPRNHRSVAASGGVHRTPHGNSLVLRDQTVLGVPKALPWASVDDMIE
jgi:hypothetical protein